MPVLMHPPTQVMHAHCDVRSWSKQGVSCASRKSQNSRGLHVAKRRGLLVGRGGAAKNMQRSLTATVHASLTRRRWWLSVHHREEASQICYQSSQFSSIRHLSGNHLSVAHIFNHATPRSEQVSARSTRRQAKTTSICDPLACMGRRRACIR